MNEDRDGSSKDALDHAWNWFALHAGQRMQSFNFFLVATAFLVAAYATVLAEHRQVAVVIGLLGAWVSFWFNRLEHRTRQLVKAGEAALKPLEQRLAQQTGIPSLEIAAGVEDQKPAGASKYSTAINVIQWTILIAFMAGFLYAAWPSLGGLAMSQASSWLNGAGLVIGTVGAILMAYFPPRVQQYTEKGEPTVSWIAKATEEGTRRGKWQRRLSIGAPYLLALAFLLQFIALLLSVRS